MRSPKFLQVDGGWNRIVWMPSSVKERVKDFIQQDVVNKIATEKDVQTIDELKVFLEKMAHPIVERWKAAPVEAVPKPEVAEEIETPVEIPVSTLPVTAGGFKIILKDAKIYAKKIIIRRMEE
jgi:acetyl-CoA decarbonylase/synthase complex subunit beta